MLKLILSAIGLAATDCLDPLSISVQVYLLTTKRAILNSLGFILGILLSTLICGAVITLGPVQELNSFFAHPKAVYFVFQTIVGFLLIWGSYHYWYHFSLKKTKHKMSFKVTPISCFFLGGTFTITDLPTNIPLLALSEELARINANFVTIVLGCLAYSLTRIAPLLIVVFLYSVNREGASEIISKLEEKLLKFGHYVVAATILILGLALVIDSAIYFATGKPLFVL